MNKKKKHHTIFYHLTIWILVFIFIGMSISLITLQTTYGKEKIKTFLISYASKNNIDVKVEKIDGILPFEYKLKNVSIEVQNYKYTIDDLNFRIKLFPLLKKTLSFKSFIANGIDVSSTILSSTSTSTKKDSLSNENWISLPIKVNFDNLKLNNLNLNIKGTSLILSMSGKAKILKFGKMILADLNIRRKDFKKSYLDIFFKAYKKNNFFKSKANLYVATAEVLKPFYQKDQDFSFNLNLNTLGNIGNFENLNTLFTKIEGDASGNILKVQNIPSFFNKESKFSFDFATLNDLSINISKGFLRNDLFEIYLDALINKDFRVDKTNITLRVDELKNLNDHLLGSFLSKIKYENNKLLSEFDFKDFSILDISFIDLKGQINGEYLDNILKAKLTSSTFAFNEPVNISCDLNFEKLFLKATNLNISTPSSNLLANIELTPSLNLLGKGRAHFDNLNELLILYPKKMFSGIVDTAFEFNQKVEKEKSFQNIYFDITAQSYFFENIFGKTSKIYLSIDNPFKNPQIDVKSTFHNLKFHDLNINQIDFSCSTIQENWPYELKILANLKKPIELESTGFFKIKKDEFNLNIQDIKGTLFSKNFISPKPIIIEVKKDKFLLSDLDIEFATSSILADINFNDSSSKAKVNLKNFPIDFLSINPLDLDVTGFVDLNLEIEKNSQTNGVLDIDINNLKILALGDEKPLQASGSLKSKIKNDYFNVQSALKLKNTQILSINGSIPIDLDLPTLKLQLNNEKDLVVDLNYNGRIEELLDFINIGPQRLEGDLKTDLHLTNNLKNLKMKGFCTFQNGYFENYYTGTILKNLTAEMEAIDEKVTLKYLKGKDLENGSITVDGIFSLSQNKNFPFYFKTQIDDLLCVDSNIIKATASARFEISGDSLSSIAKGDAKINNLDMAIPSKLPIVIPDLKAVFISHPAQKQENKSAHQIYPIHLNFDLDATNPIKIHGQGLSSTWMGNFKIGGTYMNFETFGDLRLLKGSYVFAGRHFDLTKGIVSFTGKPNELPILDIQASMKQRDVNIIADVEGPLDSPKITFSSFPPLPSSSIMSLLIFGQPLNELSESQTIELATTMSQKLDESTLSSPNTLSNLGIDRFNIIQPTTTDPTSSDQMAIQFGKYITKGIVVSLAQGAEQGSSNIIIEVDLKKGFIFQAETQQQEEQGKFSLKWRHNY